MKILPKYGSGLNKEVFLAVKAGEISEPFCIKDIKTFIDKRGWDVPEKYINVCLANAAAENHSLTYKKYFRAFGDGQYKLTLNK